MILPKFRVKRGNRRVFWICSNLFVNSLAWSCRSTSFELLGTYVYVFCLSICFYSFNFLLFIFDRSFLNCWAYVFCLSVCLNYSIIFLLALLHVFDIYKFFRPFLPNKYVFQFSQNSYVKCSKNVEVWKLWSMRVNFQLDNFLALILKSE